MRRGPWLWRTLLSGTCILRQPNNNSTQVQELQQFAQQTSQSHSCNTSSLHMPQSVTHRQYVSAGTAAGRPGNPTYNIRAFLSARKEIDISISHRSDCHLHQVLP